MARTYNLPDLTGNGGKLLRVNATEDGVERVEVSGGGSSGSGSPIGSVTPGDISEIYVDTDTNIAYVAYGATSSDRGELNYL